MSNTKRPFVDTLYVEELRKFPEDELKNCPTCRFGQYCSEHGFIFTAVKLHERLQVWPAHADCTFSYRSGKRAGYRIVVTAHTDGRTATKFVPLCMEPQP